MHRYICADDSLASCLLTDIFHACTKTYLLLSVRAPFLCCSKTHTAVKGITSGVGAFHGSGVMFPLLALRSSLQVVQA